MRVAERLQQLGIEIPPVSPLVNPTRGTARVGNVVYVSARAPKIGGVLQYRGKIGSDLTLEQGRKAARIAALNALATLQDGIGDLERVKQIVKVTGFVNSAPDFVEQHLVMN